jgi:hypothetical protein
MIGADNVDTSSYEVVAGASKFNFIAAGLADLPFRVELTLIPSRRNTETGARYLATSRAKDDNAKES